MRAVLGTEIDRVKGTEDPCAVGSKGRVTERGLLLGLGLVAGLAGAGCGGTMPPGQQMMTADGGTGTDPGSGSTCTLTANTTETATVSPKGCHVLTRDTSSCDAARKAAGLSGYWLKFSCRVALSKPSATTVRAAADGQPDYKSFYFATTSACYETYSGGVRNPNSIAAQQYMLDFPVSPNTTATPMRGAVVGLALNGVPIFGNFAAPGDDIYQEAMTFDRCGAHPQMTGQYHYHSEPYALSYDDSNFIGVMRDGYPIYGRRDPDGSRPTLDTYGGHTGTTVDSPATAVYHYHVNEQTSTGANTAGQKQWFLTTGTFRGTPPACTGC